MRVEGCIAAQHRIKTFLGSYPLRLLLRDGNEALVGRGSTSLIHCFTFIAGHKYSQPVFEAGHFCEAADCRILVGGDHLNENIYNGTFASFPVIRAALQAAGTVQWQGRVQVPTRIGHGVILSSGCTILQGANIGNGAVIGAMSVATGTAIPPYTIAAGNPTRLIRTRLSEEASAMADELEWWNWDITCLLQHARLLLEAEKNFAELMRVKKLADQRIRLVVDVATKNETGSEYITKVVGYEEEDRYVAMEAAPPQVRDYFRQMHLPENQSLIWVPDIFRELMG